MTWGSRIGLCKFLICVSWEACSLPEPKIRMYSDKVEPRRDFLSSRYDIWKGRSLLAMERIPYQGAQRMARGVRVKVTGEVLTEQFVTQEPDRVIQYAPGSW